MELIPGIVADGTALYLDGARALVLSDLHIGYEQERRAAGILLPEEQKRFFLRELDRLFKRHNVGTVVLAGDVKHEFGRISDEEWRDVRDLIFSIRKRGADVKVVGGNHDNLIRPILDRLSIPLVRGLILKNKNQEILVLHGDEELKTLVDSGSLEKEDLDADVILIGHEHPSLRITDGLRTETVKCFLVGPYRHGRKKYQMVVMPSSNPLTFGTDVLRERPLGPLLDSFGGFSAFAVLDERVLAFGSLEMMQRRVS